MLEGGLAEMSGERAVNLVSSTSEGVCHSIAQISELPCLVSAETPRVAVSQSVAFPLLLCCNRDGCSSKVLCSCCLES